MWELGRASDAEALRLMLAFLRVNEPERRKALIDLAELFERNSAPLPKKVMHKITQDNEVLMHIQKT